MISSKVSSSPYSRSMLLVTGTFRYRLLLTATTHRRITPFSRVALSSYSYSTSSYSCSVGEEEEEMDFDDNYDNEEENEGHGIDEMDLPTIKRHAKWTDDLVTLR